jgi:hypothetical protein
LYAAASPVMFGDPSGREFTILGVNVSNAVIGIISGAFWRAVGFGAVGGAFGLVDAWLGDEPLWPAAKSGLITGAGIGIFWPFRAWRLFVSTLIALSGGFGAYDSFQHGKIAQGIFRIAIVLLIVKSGLGRGRAKPPGITRADLGGVERIRWHLETQVGDGAGDDPPNRAMIQRLVDGMWDSADQEFYKHELLEAELMEQGMPYDAAHETALKEFGVTERDLYHPEVIQEHPELFNDSWFQHWHLPKPQRGGGGGGGWGGE